MAEPASHRLRATLVAAVVGSVLVGGCTHEEGAPGPASAASESLSPSGVGVPRLRLGDSGEVVALRAGGTAVVLLPNAGWDWSDPDVDGRAVSVSEDVSDAPTTSRSWTISARAAGTARVWLTGTPSCVTEVPPCAAPELRWEVTVTVHPGA